MTLVLNGDLKSSSSVQRGLYNLVLPGLYDESGSVPTLKNFFLSSRSMGFSVIFKLRLRVRKSQNQIVIFPISDLSINKKDMKSFQIDRV